MLAGIRRTLSRELCKARAACGGSGSRARSPYAKSWWNC